MYNEMLFFVPVIYANYLGYSLVGFFSDHVQQLYWLIILQMYILKNVNHVSFKWISPYTLLVTSGLLLHRLITQLFVWLLAR